MRNRVSANDEFCNGGHLV